MKSLTPGRVNAFNRLPVKTWLFWPEAISILLDNVAQTSIYLPLQDIERNLHKHLTPEGEPEISIYTLIGLETNLN